VEEEQKQIKTLQKLRNRSLQLKKNRANQSLRKLRKKKLNVHEAEAARAKKKWRKLKRRGREEEKARQLKKMNRWRFLRKSQYKKFIHKKPMSNLKILKMIPLV
jgi:hypothetical protein